MSYRCGVCGAPSPPRQNMLVHRIYRTNGQIAREIPVCQDCNAALSMGVSLAQLKADHKRFTEVRAIPGTPLPSGIAPPSPPPPVPTVSFIPPSRLGGRSY